MKKGIIVVVAIAALAGLSLPYINGRVMERIVYEASDNINQMYTDSGSDIKIEIEQYDRGVTKSFIDWKIDLGMFASVYGIDEIRFVEEADHGYKGVTSQTRLENNPWFQDFLDQYLNGQNPFQIKTVYPLKGDIVSTITMDAFTVDNAEGITGSVKPATMSLSMDKHLTRIGTDLSWQGLHAGDMIQVDGLSAKTQLNRISTHIWAGTSSFNLAQLWVKDKGDHVAMKNATADTQIVFHKESNRLDISLGMGVEELAEKGAPVLDGGVFKVHLDQLDAAGYEQIAQMYAAMVSDMVKAMGEKGFDPQKMDSFFQRHAAAQGLQMMTEFEKLLRKGLMIRISELKARLPKGEVDGFLRLALKKNMTMAGFMPVMMNPDILLDIFDLETRLTLPEALGGNNPNLYQPLYPGMQTGLFIRENGQICHQAKTTDGKLYINQKEVSLKIR